MLTDDIDIKKLKAELAFLRLKWQIIRGLLVFKDYDPSQPRVPAGSPDGGRWTGGGSASGRDSGVQPKASETPGRLTAASRRQLSECERQFNQDLFQCRMVGLRTCYAQAIVRQIACEKGHPIPPLNY